MFQCDETVASIYTVLDEFVVLSSLLSEIVNHFLKDVDTRVQQVISLKREVGDVRRLKSRSRSVFLLRMKFNPSLRTLMYGRKIKVSV